MSPAFLEGLLEIITTDLQKNSLRSSFLFLVGQDTRPQVWHGAGPAPFYNAGLFLTILVFAIIS